MAGMDLEPFRPRKREQAGELLAAAGRSRGVWRVGRVSAPEGSAVTRGQRMAERERGPFGE